MRSTTTSSANVKITFWRGNGRQLETSAEDEVEREEKKLKVNKDETENMADATQWLTQSLGERFGGGTTLRYLAEMTPA